MKLHLEGKGEHMWCVHDEEDDHVGAMICDPSDSTKFIYRAKDLTKEIHAVDSNAALVQVQSMYDSGELKGDDGESSDGESSDEKPVDGDMISGYIHYQVRGLFILADKADQMHTLVNAFAHHTAQFISALPTEQQKMFIDALTHKINEELEEQQRRKKMMDGLAGSLGEVLSRVFGGLREDSETGQEPKKPVAH